MYNNHGTPMYYNVSSIGVCQDVGANTLVNGLYPRSAISVVLAYS